MEISQKSRFSTYVTVTFLGLGLAVSGSSSAGAQVSVPTRVQAPPSPSSASSSFSSNAASGPTNPVLNLKPEWHPQASRDEDKIETRESDVFINGVYYDRIEYEGKQYLVRLQKSDSPDASEQFDCDSPQRNDLEPRLAEAQLKVTERSRLFVEGLMKRCRQSADYNTTTTLSPGGIAGIAIEPITKDGHEKKIFYDPLIGGAGFKTDW